MTGTNKLAATSKSIYMNDKFEPDQEFNNILKCVIEIGNMLAKQPFSHENENIKFAESLGKKILNHALTVNYIYQGFQPRTNTEVYAPQVDFSGICVLTRACLEAYLTFNYLFISPKTKLEGEFKFLCWDLGGYIDREDFPANQPNHIAIKEAEKKEIERLKKEIESHPYLNPDQIKQKTLALEGNWRLKNSWSKIGANAGFQPFYFDNMYSFLCGHSHSSRLSIIQVEQTKDISEQRDVSKACLGLLKMVLSKYIYEYVNLIPKLKGEVDFQSEKYKDILIWKEIAESYDGN